MSRRVFWNPNQDKGITTMKNPNPKGFYKIQDLGGMEHQVRTKVTEYRSRILPLLYEGAVTGLRHSSRSHQEIRHQGCTIMNVTRPSYTPKVKVTNGKVWCLFGCQEHIRSFQIRHICLQL